MCSVSGCLGDGHNSRHCPLPGAVDELNSDKQLGTEKRMRWVFDDN